MLSNRHWFFFNLFILFYFVLFILFYFILFYFILFYFILFSLMISCMSLAVWFVTFLATVILDVGLGLMLGFVFALYFVLRSSQRMNTLYQNKFYQDFDSIDKIKYGTDTN
ncbi:hypothetical protein KUTeg_021222 [Tegillarca granosa]|uniref:NADH dehydrogenase subunit 4L n=1 Tax=Tegillarca granosa TaxID=220873 RepID=A0ABQ9EFM4_TEGGR|nr:hypothetical protein KUTeg_021222 [Tegillarca granosa]